MELLLFCLCVSWWKNWASFLKGKLVFLRLWLLLHEASSNKANRNPLISNLASWNFSHHFPSKISCVIASRQPTIVSFVVVLMLLVHCSQSTSIREDQIQFYLLKGTDPIAEFFRKTQRGFRRWRNIRINFKFQFDIFLAVASYKPLNQ